MPKVGRFKFMCILPRTGRFGFGKMTYVAKDEDVETSARWSTRYKPIRDTGDPDYPDNWHYEQCGGCNAYRPIDGPLGEDWGVCTNPASPADGSVRFEHDGCDAFVPAEPRTAPFV